MGIAWNKAAIERIIGALLASHPGFTPNYKTMAVHFGQGATYDSIQGRFREYRRIAKIMRQDNPGPSSSRAPVGRNIGSGRVSKPGSTARGHRTQTPLTPTKYAKVKVENSVLDDLLIDEGSAGFIKGDEGDSIPFSEAPANSTSTPEAKRENPFVVRGNLKIDYDCSNDFLSGLENVTASLAEESENALRYSSEVAGFAQYDDTV
ncbi:hypothetical protein AJ78_04093 [Emergomyces pasteurianus Ep9510]|uniref:Uncharacterized protein n=1 Tax=Emergomyces pasteurianus Ep9510 TaxID=1447872 RepID=A0A1J9Q628_9EURO|nr:hypothetical protein AJ78_04093 [Emergomyces pasteurianus Ep9510]